MDKSSIVGDIVRQDHHAADVFRKYGIEYCCGGRWSLETACMMKGLKFEVLKIELEKVGRTVLLPPSLDFDSWDIDFLTNYIINVHHSYLKKAWPATEEIVRNFAEGHKKKYPYMNDVSVLLTKLVTEILLLIAREEETIFPYIGQVAHAYKNRNSYSGLPVKSLPKPFDVIMHYEPVILIAPLVEIRKLTGNYMPPDNACVSHRVSLARLKEFDNDLMQHIYLENEILFPQALEYEQELLGLNSYE